MNRNTLCLDVTEMNFETRIDAHIMVVTPVHPRPSVRSLFYCELVDLSSQLERTFRQIPPRTMDDGLSTSERVRVVVRVRPRNEREEQLELGRAASSCHNVRSLANETVRETRPLARSLR